MTPDPARLDRFARFAWFLLGYNLLVVLWGAFVRATGSGAGCGSHWPLCNGEVLPRPESLETVVEFTHRLTSGIDGLLVLALLVWAFRLFPRRHPVRFGAVWAFLFLVSESLVGAGLVRFELVADNASTARALVMMAHLLNTFLLLAGLTVTAAWARLPFGDPADDGAEAEDGAPSRRWLPLVVRPSDPVPWVLGLGVVGMLLLGVSGAIAALGDTLFPVSSFQEGWAQKLDPAAHILVRLRIWHPAVALAVGLWVMLSAGWLRRRRPVAPVRRVTAVLVGIYLVQLVLGVVNVLLAAPVWMQLVHLLVADLAWIALVLLVLDALSPEATAAAAATDRRPAGAAGPRPELAGRA